ncbi:MAG: glycoside hydrolase [Bacilli bacterium]|nr:glycoside hydrolase [Bacilli bacterium]
MKIIVFYDEKFPYNGSRPSSAWLLQLSQLFEVVDAQSLAAKLSEQVSCLILLHGPYFPKNAWAAIVAHLKRGSGLLHIGGAPFQLPVRAQNGQWIPEHVQTAYHQQLNIHEALPIDPSSFQSFKANEDIPLLVGRESLFTLQSTYGLVLHVTHADDHPGEIGSSGPMDAHIYPLLTAVSNDGRQIAAPVVLIENTKGDFAGGRWIFINQQLDETFWGKDGMTCLKEWGEFCSRNVTEIWMKPNYAVYEAGETAKLTVQLQTQHSGWAINEDFVEQQTEKWTFEIQIVSQCREQDWKRNRVAFYQLNIESSYELSLGAVAVPVTDEGFYEIECTAQSSLGETRILRQGFWCYDRDLLQSGTPLSSDRDYFWKEGRPLPIVGMTYMTSDVARKYLFMPNVSIWNKDMAQMKKAGINLIRTGIWTAHRHVMFIDGHPSEEVLRAIDAFILTAKRYELEVTFNFFAFVPEQWEGVNPYLDPRSMKAQKRLISSVVSRHAKTTNIHWDLINEPSLFNPKRVFNGPQPNKDTYERTAFIEWIKHRHPSIEQLQERWQMTPVQLPDFAAVQAPAPEEISFNVQDMGRLKKGLRWLDYCLFSMDMHNRWASELSSAIKRINPEQLVTIGQDEGLGGLRPSPFFYAEAVDYTTVHSWWLMDQLVWDGIFTKTPYKPNLVQETGIMYLEQADGHAKRSELELRNILERKYAYAFSTGGAGAVQWIWNTNFYMDNINESNIGALRADGTEKPEADISYDFGHFMQNIRDLFEERELEEVVVIYPYSNDFSNRRLSVDSTAKLTRVLAYEMKIPFRAFGEYHLDALQDHCPKLIIVPSAHNFSDQAFDKLITHVRINGGTLLLTGPISLNEYWQFSDRLPELSQLGDQCSITNVLREEMLDINGQSYPVAFGGKRIAEVSQEIRTDSSNLVHVPMGRGLLLWCRLPLELNDRSEPLKAIYRYALNEACVKDELIWIQGSELPGVYGRKIRFKKGSLFIFVSEFSQDTALVVQDPITHCEYSFVLERERSVLFAVDETGQLIDVYRPNQVQIELRNRSLTRKEIYEIDSNTKESDHAAGSAY